MSAIGYDLGNHSSYVALVRTGGIDTVDNEYSYRATPTSVSFSDVMRFTGNAAKSRIITDFRNTFSSFKNLIGLDFDDPMAQFEMSMIPAKFIKMEDGKIGVQASYLGECRQFSIFQLVAAVLSDLRKTTLRHIQKISTCVFSTPNYFSHFQRSAFLAACEVADFHPTCIISDTAAVCLNYVLFKSDLPKDNEDPRIVAFVDVGYSSTQICIAAFNGSKVKVLSSLGTNIFGGRMFDKVLFDRFSSEFAQKYKIDVKSNPKAHLKLLNECEILKKQLNSTSTELPLKIECFMNDIDVMSKTSREEFDILSESLYTTFRNLILQALDAAKLDAGKVHSIEAIGGSSRLLGLRRVISEIFGKEASTTLNADEAISRGCAIKCALVSPIVRIREIDFKDIIPIDFTAHYTSKTNEMKSIKVYSQNSMIPAKKELVFAPSQDFSFNVTQTDIAGSTRTVCVCSVSCPEIGDSAEKLTFWCNVDMSCLFTVVKAFYTLPKEEEESLEGDDGEKKPKSIKVNNEVKFTVKYTEDYSHIVSDAKKMEIEMLNQIEIEKERSAAKNNLEEFIYSSRDSCESSCREYIAEDELGNYMNALSTEEEWLYDEGSNQTAEVYQNRLLELQNMFLPFKSRKEAFENGRVIVDNLFKSLMHYRKFLDVYSQNQAKYAHLSLEEVNEYSLRISQTETFAFQADSALKTTPKCKLPPVSLIDLEQKNIELKTLCEKLLKKAETAPQQPPKPAQPETQPPTAENNTPEVSAEASQPNN